MAVVCLLGGGFCTSAEAATTYPTYAADLADASFVPVYLPPDPQAAITLIHRWNALTATMESPPDGKAGWRVPTLAQAFGADGRNGRDPDRSPAVAGWAVEWSAWHGRRDAADSQALLFGLVAAPGVLLLPVPGEQYRQRLQTFADHSWLAEGHAQPPRMQQAGAEPSSESTLAPIVVSIALLLAVVVGGWLISRRPPRAQTQPPAADQ